MDQLRRLFYSLSLRQRITLGIVVAAVVSGLMGLSHWGKERDFKPLFTKLAPEEAGLVVTRIRESGSEYRLAEGGTSILVPSGKVAELRLQLAAAGMPKSGRLGFELFDKTNFGVTDFAEQVTYHRAVEGELERSIMSLSEVELARVHVTFLKDSIYLESKQPAKASVTVKLRPGARLSPQNVSAICHLAASAVEGLQPDGVSVLDTNGNLLNRPKRAGLEANEPSDAVLEYRQKVERDMLAKIHATLEPLLGADKYRTGVTVDCDFTSGEQSEEVYDPTKSVMVTSQRTEDGTAAATASGVPGTASNLPRPASRPVAGSAGASRRTENVSYQSSRFIKHLKLPQGGIKRVSVSVLLDQAVRFEKSKRIIEPPSPEKLKVVKDMVAGIAGISAERGDQIIVETFPFEATLNVQPPGAVTGTSPLPPAGAWGPAWLQQLMKQNNFAVIAGVAVGVVLVLFTLILAVLMRGRGGKKSVRIAKALDNAPTNAIDQAPPDIQKEMAARLAEQATIKEAQTRDVLNSLKLPPVTTKKTEVLVKHIASETKKDPTLMAHVIRTWMSGHE